jgi:predicted Rossmann fold nucleotide-binding protein DprA/Smf involved in DNA uptake
MHEQEKIYQLALSLIKGVGFNTWKRLIERFKTAQSIFTVQKIFLQTVFQVFLRPLYTLF